MGSNTRTRGTTGVYRPFERRAGFTLIEVMIAALVLVVALGGILSMTIAAMKKSDMPAMLQGSIMAAQDRLEYFRSQANPYFAAGGTYHSPPVRRGDPDFGTQLDGANVNIRFNTGPALFVREYLYAFNEGRGVVAGSIDTGRNQMDTRAGNVAAANEIPATPVNVGGPLPAPITPITGIMPNPENVAAPAYAAGVAQAAGGQNFIFNWAPRANDQFRYNGAILPDAVKFVREVWVQTNNPNIRVPMDFVPFAGSATYQVGILGALGNPTPPLVQPNLPPYTIAVTVRVFARDSRIRILAAAAAPATGIGYDRTKPLATMIGYYGLRRL